MFAYGSYTIRISGPCLVSTNLIRQSTCFPPCHVNSWWWWGCTHMCGGGLARALALAIHFSKSTGGFSRTWYPGNHCCGRASQLGSNCHILAMGIPAVRHLLISSDSRATPMHPRCPHPVAGGWLDTRLMVSVFFGWFLVRFLLFVSSCRANSERSRTAAVWVRRGAHVWWLLQQATVTNGQMMSSIMYVMEPITACGMNMAKNKAYQCGLRSWHWSACHIDTHLL